MWLECIGVVSGCCCIRRYIDNSHNNYYFALIHLYLLSFWQQHPYFFVIFKMFFVLVYVIFVQFYNYDILKDYRHI